MVEFELTYLAKYLPEDLSKFPSNEMMDIYIPVAFDHPKIRIRKNGDKFEITKKEPVHGTDSSEQLEQTITITAEEFQEFTKIPGKVLKKRRYFYKIDNRTAEIDVFGGELTGLVLVDVEFNNNDEKNEFSMPGFCLAEVTQEKFIAGGMLCGKKYSDIEENLREYNYTKLTWDTNEQS